MEKNLLFQEQNLSFKRIPALEGILLWWELKRNSRELFPFVWITEAPWYEPLQHKSEIYNTKLNDLKKSYLFEKKLKFLLKELQFVKSL